MSILSQHPSLISSNRLVEGRETFMYSDSACYSDCRIGRTSKPGCVQTRRFQDRLYVLVATIAIGLCIGGGAYAQEAKVPERSFVAANGLKITVKEVAPGNQDSSLQVVCYLKHKQAGDVVIEALVTLDEQLGGVIHALRDRGAFTGEPLESLYFIPKQGSVKAKGMLLVGVGDEKGLSLETMRNVGTVALREAMLLNAGTVSFAPTLRDQKVSKLDVGDVGGAVVQGVILAYDTDKRLQKQGLLPEHDIQEWIYNAGPAYFARTVDGVQQAVQKEVPEATSRSAAPFGSRK
jgi:cytosol aminopeptidase family protein